MIFIIFLIVIIIIQLINYNREPFFSSNQCSSYIETVTCTITINNINNVGNSQLYENIVKGDCNYNINTSKLDMTFDTSVGKNNIIFMLFALIQQELNMLPKYIKLINELNDISSSYLKINTDSNKITVQASKKDNSKKKYSSLHGMLLKCNSSPINISQNSTYNQPSGVPIQSGQCDLIPIISNNVSLQQKLNPKPPKLYIVLSQKINLIYGYDDQTQQGDLCGNPKLSVAELKNFDEFFTKYVRNCSSKWDNVEYNEDSLFSICVASCNHLNSVLEKIINLESSIISSNNVFHDNIKLLNQYPKKNNSSSRNSSSMNKPSNNSEYNLGNIEPDSNSLKVSGGITKEKVNYILKNLRTLNKKFNSVSSNLSKYQNLIGKNINIWNEYKYLKPECVYVMKGKKKICKDYLLKKGDKTLCKISKYESV